VIYIDFVGLNFKPLPHQIKTARKVIDEFNGRAILADEVGLGKTIEAGLIIKEYIKNDEIRKLLILVPASLGFQWTNELVNKFNISNIFYNRKGVVWDYFDYQIASLDKAKRERHASKIRKIYFDLVIVDEAHHLKNKDTLNWKFVNSLKKKYFLLLTATPIHNNLKELYNLILLLNPDYYKDYNDFKHKYIQDKHIIKNSNELKKDLKRVMIRNTHNDTELNNSKRLIRHISVELNEKEKSLYKELSNYIKNEYSKKRKNKNILDLITYQRELCSSTFALKQTLEKKSKLDPALKRLLDIASKITVNTKMKKVAEILKETDGQVIIFTEYRATQLFVAYYLENLGYKTIIFNGSFSSSGKEWVRYIFQQKKDVLISTEAGSQGLNFQFSNVIINYDLPWNPMKLEQRIGRVHRLGQTRNVYIYNIVSKGTVEEKILDLLNKKIKLFKDVIGEKEDILQPKNNLESDIIKIIGESKDNNEIEKRFKKIAKL